MNQKLEELSAQAQSAAAQVPVLGELLAIPLRSWVMALSILTVGWFLSRRSRFAINRLRGLDRGQKELGQKLAFGTILAVTAALALDQLGFNLKVLLGAAGVLTVAVGFAAQTSASNLISGLFLMFERPFVIGQVIAVGDLQGEVIGIGLLSTQIRAFNNVVIRIPNETLVKSNINNLSHFPIRRIRLDVGVAYDTDLEHVEKLLKSVVEGHPRTLTHPEPQVLITQFAESSVDFQLLVWVPTELALTLPHELFKAVHKVFEENQITIPFPTRTLVQVDPGVKANGNGKRREEPRT